MAICRQPCACRRFDTRSFTGYDTLAARLTQQFEQYVKLSQNSNADQLLTAIRVDDIGRLADIICANLVLSIEEKQELVEIFNPVERCKRLADMYWKSKSKNFMSIVPCRIA